MGRQNNKNVRTRPTVNKTQSLHRHQEKKEKDIERLNKKVIVDL